jgi:hypothetical protein
MSFIGFSYTRLRLTIASTESRGETLMTGETSLGALLRSMAPELNDGAYVFCTVPDINRVAGADVLGSIREREGLTVILERSQAQALKLDAEYVMAWITLTVHSSLAAVGLTAAFARALGDAGISCNVVAGFYHDHLFVGKDDALKAMATLRALAANA